MHSETERLEPLQSALANLKLLSTVVADTGEFDQVEKYLPEDSTTNPSLILGAMSKPEYAHLIREAVDYARAQQLPSQAETLSLAADKLFVGFGVELLKRIPGRVSSEVDARLSFDAPATVARAQRLLKLYEDAGVDSKRVLIKIASTWEGLQAAAALQAMGIDCNMTLIFSASQSRVAGEVGARLISPFVGRITDYWAAKRKASDPSFQGFSPEQDPGVLCVRNIAREMNDHFARRVEVMGASFRNVGQVLALAGLPLLTIAPGLLQELDSLKEHPVPALVSNTPPESLPHRAPLTQAEFLFQLNADECASFKLAEGIRKFVQDQEALEAKLVALL
ncbi:MAG: transaldolase family protein [archaeon]|nr:transaldolase family protein [archaeon]